MLCLGQPLSAPTSPGTAQTAAQAGAAAQVPEFEVISVKPDKNNPNCCGARFRADGLTVVGLSVHDMLTEGFHVFDDQMVNEPAWMKTELWDIEAKVGGDDVAELDKLSFDQRAGMFLQIVTQRFGLKVHHETRELPVYDLVVAKGGEKMAAAKPFQNPPAVAKGGPGRMEVINRGKLQAQGTTMPYVASVLENEVHRKIVDKTGLTGTFDFTLTWMPDQVAHAGVGAGQPAPDESAPSIFTAVQEQLGLKLEPSKGPVDVIVVDHIEKPSEN